MGRFTRSSNKLTKYKEIIKLTNDSYGLDTCIFNYIFDEHNDILLDSTYNYLTKQDFIIKNGIYYDTNGTKINILHVAGQSRDKPESYYPQTIK